MLSMLMILTCHLEQSQICMCLLGRGLPNHTIFGVLKTHLTSEKVFIFNLISKMLLTMIIMLENQDPLGLGFPRANPLGPN